MKILFFIDSLRAGGKERRLTELLKVLKLNHDIEFELVVMSNDIHYQEVFKLGINIHHFIRKTKKDISIFCKFYKLCKSYNPDIVHCWDSMTAVYSVPICKLLKIKLINGMVVDSPMKQNIFNKNWFWAKITFPFSDVILGNSFAGLIAYSAPSKKSVVIHNGFNFRRIEDLITPETIKKRIGAESDYIIGMVASFSDKKDYKTFYRAAQMLLDKRKDIVFLAIGSNTDSILSINQIGEKYKKQFRLIGKISDTESYINVMDICVLATFTEGISNSILEYMALGKPVIATDGGGTNEIVQDSVTGYLVNPSNPSELLEKMEILLNSDELRCNMGFAAKQKVLNHFSIEKMINKHITMYQNLLSGSKIFFLF